jgi:hypothetical protein
MRGEECGESSSPIIPDSEGEVNMSEHDFMVILKALGDRIALLEYQLDVAEKNNQQLIQTLKDLQAGETA